MKEIILFLVLVLSVLNAELRAQGEERMVIGEQKIFKVSRASNPITIDGKMDEAAWERTEARSFEYFYRIEKPTDKQQTIFRMLWDEENLYLFFDCKDLYITARETERDGTPYFDDCAELFLIPVPDSLDMHIGFELNLYKASNDFIYFNNFYQGQNSIIKSYNPDFEVEVSVNGSINNNRDIDTGWTMEMSIPIKLFNQVDEFFPVQAGSKWAFLAVRQDRNDPEGDRRSTSTIFPIYEIEKSVHQPNRFGLLEFVK